MYSESLKKFDWDGFHNVEFKEKSSFVKLGRKSNKLGNWKEIENK